MRAPPDSVVLIDGGQAVVVAAQMADRGRIAHWSAAVDAVLAGFRAELPAGIAVDVIFDQSDYTEARIDSLAGNLGLGIVLVARRARGDDGLALGAAGRRPPCRLTLLMVLAGFYWLGVPLHQISLTGLIIALGLLIDNVIISADSYQKHREQGLPPEAAVRATARALLGAARRLDAHHGADLPRDRAPAGQRRRLRRLARYRRGAEPGLLLPPGADRRAGRRGADGPRARAAVQPPARGRRRAVAGARPGLRAAADERCCAARWSASR